MYVSIRDHVLLHAGYATIVEGLADLGLSAVELEVDRAGKVLALDAPGHAKVPLTELTPTPGVTVSAFLLATDFNSVEVEKELHWVVAVARRAAELGVPAVRIDAIMHGERDLPLAQRQQIFARGIRTILERTADLKVDFGIENHGVQGNDPEFLEGLLKRIGSQRLGITMDTGNFYWAGHPREAVYPILERLAPRTKHTHVKNIAYPEDQRDIQRPAGWEYGTYVCPIPDGDIDHARVVALLAAAGYDRDLCIEDESLGKFDRETQRAHLRAAAEHLKACIG